VARVFGVFLAFCFLSSAVYSFNDVVDAEADQQHPKKRFRPVASGAVTKLTAVLVGCFFVLLSATITWKLGPMVSLIALLYLLNNVAYSIFLKQKVVADVLSIAAGFLFRILAGAVAVDVQPSSWLLICGFSLAIFLGFCKRRSELGRLSPDARENEARPVLLVYSAEKLDLLCCSAATLTILTYMLFTVSPETVARHGTTVLVYTCPFVIYCVFRFLMKSLELKGEDATVALLRDAGFLTAGAGWVLMVLSILYWV
jgi:4-hydroxybenzoate polyprenyltransferase